MKKTEKIKQIIHQMNFSACLVWLPEGLQLWLLKEPYQTPLSQMASTAKLLAELEPFYTRMEEPRFLASLGSA
jgi:hypothetical protein